MKKLPRTKRMWMSISFSTLFAGLGVLAMYWDYGTTANILFTGSIAVIAEYLGIETYKPSK